MTASFFLHMPKCGGTSTRLLFEQQSKRQVLLDYDSHFKYPIEQRMDMLLDSLFTPTPVAPGALVFGHFFPIKYLATQQASDYKLVTILRDPLDRLYSHYQFWCQHEFPDHYLWRQMRALNWSFRDFALSQEMKNFYSQYLFQVPLRAFQYIGLFEDFEHSIQQCMEALDLGPVNLDRLSTENTTHYPSLHESISTEDRELICDWHAEDYLIYRYVKQVYKSPIDWT